MYTFQTRIHLISHRIFRARNVSVFNGNLFTFTIFLLQNIYYSNFCFMEKFVQENVCEVTYLTLVASQFCFYQRIQSQLYLFKGCHLSLHGNKTLWLYILCCIIILPSKFLNMVIFTNALAQPLPGVGIVECGAKEVFLLTCISLRCSHDLNAWI